MKNKLMKITEAAKYLGVCANTLRSWTRSKKKITYYRDNVTGYCYFKQEDLDSFMKGLKIN